MDNARQIMDASRVIAEGGGPAAPWDGEEAWCDLKWRWIYDRNLKKTEYGHDCSWCPPAVEAAVIAYTMQVRVWWATLDVRHDSLLRPAADRMWYWELRGKHWAKILYQGSKISCIAAAEAFIVAVAETLERTND